MAILETSASPWQSKISTLSQEVKRFLNNTSENLDDCKVEIISQFMSKLTRSGYSNAQKCEISLSGVTGFHNRKQRL